LNVDRRKTQVRSIASKWMVIGAAALTSLLAIGQGAKNPFAGVWAVDMNRAGTHVLAWRVELHDSEGLFYNVQKKYAGDPNAVCRNLRASIEHVVFTDTSLRFVVARSKQIQGCSDLAFALRWNGTELVGTLDGTGDNGVVAVTLSR
jgi:hypothetical protein